MPVDEGVARRDSFVEVNVEMRRISCSIILAIAAVFACCHFEVSEAASKYDAALARWSKSEESSDNMGGKFLIKATLYTAEYIQTLMESEAEKNLWTASELEDYKYNFLRSLNLEERIAMHLEMEELGPTAHMAPFGEMIYLWVGNKKYSPVDHDTRFNLPLQGKRDGMVFFPRFDEKTGRPLLNKDISLRFIMLGSASPVLGSKEIRFIWDVKAEDDVMAGTAADRVEVDRLIRRIEKLAKEKSDLEEQLETKNREILEVNSRIEELQKN